MSFEYFILEHIDNWGTNRFKVSIDKPIIFVCGGQLEYIDQYKNKSNKEALFVYALDKLMPLLFNITQNGLTWHQHNISIEQLKKVKKGKVDKDPIVNEYYKQACDLLEQNPQLFNPVKK